MTVVSPPRHHPSRHCAPLHLPSAHGAPLNPKTSQQFRHWRGLIKWLLLVTPNPLVARPYTPYHVATTRMRKRRWRCKPQRTSGHSSGPFSTPTSATSQPPRGEDVVRSSSPPRYGAVMCNATGCSRPRKTLRL